MEATGTRGKGVPRRGNICKGGCLLGATDTQGCVPRGENRREGEECHVETAGAPRRGVPRGGNRNKEGGCASWGQQVQGGGCASWRQQAQGGMVPLMEATGTRGVCLVEETGARRDGEPRGSNRHKGGVPRGGNRHKGGVPRGGNRCKEGRCASWR